jgi:ComF family protein
MSTRRARRRRALAGMSRDVYAPEGRAVTAPAHGRPAWPWRARPGGALLHLVLPACCLGCGTPLPARSPLGLCARCRAALVPLRGPRCAGCARRLDAHAPPPDWRCGACRARPPAFDRLLAAWSYEPPLDAVVQGLKFGRLDYLGAHLAAAMAERLGAGLAGCDLVVPVPLHWRRRIARGYDQAELIARPLAAHLCLPCRPLLRRRRATPPQSSLPRAARLANLAAPPDTARAFSRHGPVFAARSRHAAAAAGRRVLLVDDVATTGATLEAAAAALAQAGAASVTAAVAARTPERS